MYCTIFVEFIFLYTTATREVFVEVKGAAARGEGEAWLDEIKWQEEGN